MANQVLAANNASTTVAGAISNTATSVALASGTGALFPSPSAGQYYVASFFDQATGLITEIVHVTNMSGDIATIVRGQENTTPLAWNVGDTFANYMTAGTFGVLVQGVNANGTVNIYVNPSTGSDTLYNGLSATVSGQNGPFATIQHAYNVLSQNYYMNGNSAVINLANGTYNPASGTSVLIALNPVVGINGPVMILGNPGSPSSVIIEATLANCFEAFSGAQIELSGMTIEATGTGLNGFGISAANGGQVVIGPDVVFGACGSVHINSQFGGFISRNNGYTYNGAAPYHMIAHDGGQIYTVSGLTFTGSGTLNFSGAFAYSYDGALIFDAGSTYTGGTITGLKYLASNLGLIKTGGGGAGYYPGNTAGEADSWSYTPAGGSPGTFSLYS